MNDGSYRRVRAHATAGHRYASLASNRRVGIVTRRRACARGDANESAATGTLQAASDSAERT